MEAKHWTGGPDDGSMFDKAPTRHPDHDLRKCEHCGDWTRAEVSYARIWFFCGRQCKADWIKQHQG